MKRGDIWQVKIGPSERYVVIVASDTVIRDERERAILAVPIIAARPSLVTVTIPGYEGVAKTTAVSAIRRGSFVAKTGEATISAMDQIDASLRAILEL